MQVKEWQRKFGELARQWILSPEMEHFYSVKVNPESAKLYMLQLSLYVRNRRNYWFEIGANTPEMEVKKRILEHEYEEVIRDDYSETGHLDLLIRQGKELGLSPEEILAAEPLPMTRAAIFGWWWIARYRPWQEALAASTSSEGMNDDRLLGDIGGGSSTRLIKIWARDLELRPEQMPHFAAHSKADEKHSEMFLQILERYVPPAEEANVLRTAKESFDLIAAYFGGLAMAMERMSKRGASLSQ